MEGPPGGGAFFLSYFPASGLVIVQGIGLIYLDAAITPVAGYHVGQVVHEFRSKAVLFHFEIEGRVHVHRHAFDLPTALAELLEERTYGLRLLLRPTPERGYARRP